MKLVALLTSHVMEGIAHLPGVATQDWCSRAASALSRLHDPSGVGVMVGQLDGRGFITNVEMTGAAWSKDVKSSFGSAAPSAEPAYIAGPGEGRQTDDGLVSVREGFRVGEWLGWSFGPPSKDLLVVSSAAQLGMLQRRGESVVWRRWSMTNPTEVLGAIVAIPGSTPGRIAVVEVAWNENQHSDTSRQQAVLAAVLPMLAGKVARSFGDAPLSDQLSLTPREELVLWHLLAGEKVPVIAKRLNRSIYTVHDHVKSLHRKLGASNRGQLVARALGHLGPLQPSSEPDEPEATEVPAVKVPGRPGRKPGQKAGM
jgi:DNA-binding CsgD family transcriptional regulator